MLCASAADAQTIAFKDPEKIAALLREEGYQAKVDPAKPEENPVITSGAGGSTFGLYFYDCTKGKDCQSVQFYAGFQKHKLDMEKVNLWNREKRFVRGYIDKDGDAVLEMDVNVEPGGLSRQLFVDYLDIWSSLIGQYRARAYPD